MHAAHHHERGQSLVIVLSLITLLFLLGSSLAVHASVALRTTRTSEGQGDEFYAADAATELGIWWQRNGKAGNPPAQTINGVTTSTTITSAGGGGGSCPAAPSITWMNGFESGAVARANVAVQDSLAGGMFVASGSSGIVDVVSSPARTGGYSMRVAPNSWASNYAYVSAPYGITLGPTVVAHFAVRMGALPTTDAPVFTIMNQSSNGWQHAQLFLYYRPSTGKWALGLSLGLTPTLYQESSVTAVVGTWYSFDIRIQINGTDTRTGEWYLDGIAQPTVSVVDSAGTGSSPIVVLGQWGTSTFGGAYTAYYDDAVISSTSSDFPIGDVNLQPLKPDGMGTHNTPVNFQNEAGGAIDATSWQRIDETPMTVSDSIKQVTASATSYIETTLSDTSQTCIRGADAMVGLHNGGTSANSTKTSIFDGATESIVFSGDSSLTSGTLNYAQKPITAGGAWSQARVNGLKLRLGYGADINPLVSWDSVVVEVAWSSTAAAPVTYTIVGTGGGSTVSTSYTDAGAGIPTLTTWTTTK